MSTCAHISFSDTRGKISPAHVQIILSCQLKMEYSVPLSPCQHTTISTYREQVRKVATFTQILVLIQMTK